MTKGVVAPPAVNAIVAPWMSEVVGRCQVFIGLAEMLEDPTELEALVQNLTGTIPKIQMPAEERLLRALLIEVAAKAGARIHRRFHGPPMRRCGFVPASLLDHFWSGPRGTAQDALESWAHAFSTELMRAHPPSCAQRATRRVSDDIGRAWNVSELAREIGATPSQLCRTFRRDYGLTPRAYQTRMRLVRALEQLADGTNRKIEPIAIEAGFRSKKNFYRALVKLTELTPTQFRALTPGRARTIIESVTPQRERRTGQEA